MSGLMDNIFLASMRGHFRKKFEFKEIDKVIFTCNKLSDELGLEGYGINQNSIYEIIRLNNLKLSENSDFTEMFIGRIKTKIEFKELTLIYLTINFKEKKIDSEIYFIDEHDNKRKINLTQQNGKINQVQ